MSQNIKLLQCVLLFSKNVTIKGNNKKPLIVIYEGLKKYIVTFFKNLRSNQNRYKSTFALARLSLVV